MATMDVKDVIGDSLAKIIEAATGKKRHAELAEAVNKLVASLQTGAFVVSSSDLDKKQPDERSERSAGGGGLPDDRVAELLVPIRLALSSRSPKIIDATLASVQKLIAHGFVRGDADLPPPPNSQNLRAAPAVPKPEPNEGTTPEPETKPAPAREETPETSTMNDVARVSTIHECRHSRLADAHAAELVELVCAASDVPDETVELQMLKCLLTAVSSWTFRVRARALLRVVRACVNAYLGSASEVNQTTAKASLTQMLAVVFHRLETRSRETRDAPAPTIVVADVFSSSLARRTDREGTTAGVRKSSVFGNRGLSLAALAAANAVKPTEEDAAAQMTTFVQGFINKVSADLTAVAAAAAGEDTDDLVEWTPASAAAKHREVTDLEFDNDGDATPAKERKGKESLPRAEETRDVSSETSRVSEASDASLGDARRVFPEEASVSGGENSRNSEDEALSQLEEDAFLVFRALCKLAKKPGDLTNPAVARGKTLSLELLRILLENAGLAFRRSPRLNAAVSEYLCDAVVVCASQTAVPAAHGLALCAFLAALKNFRHTLKAEIAVFFPALLLDPLEAGDATCASAGGFESSSGSSGSSSPASSFQRRAVLLACARELCRDPRLMADLFVNYDCDLDSTNLFERFVEALARAAGRKSAAPTETAATSVPSNAPYPPTHPDDLAREQSLRLEALECLGVLLESLRDWVAGVDERVSARDHRDSLETTTERDDAASRLTRPASGPGPAPDAPSAKIRERRGETPPDTLAGIEAMKASKTEYQSAIALFNAKPKKGVAAMQNLSRCGKTPAAVAAFLRDANDLDKTAVGEYLGERDEGCLAVMHAYVDAMDFSEMALDEAIRAFLSGFRLPGESQKIDRLMEKFAERFCVCNPGAYKSADTAYVLAFSVIMLNTDAHNPQVKRKMTAEQFLRNNRGIDDGADVPAAHLRELYDRIVSDEIRMKDDDPRLLAEKAELNAGKASSNAGVSASQSINRAMKDMSNRLGVDQLIALMGTQKKIVHEVDTSAFMARVRERAARDAAGSFQRVRDPNCAGIMFAQFRDACLGTFRDAFDAVPDAPSETETHVVDECLAGYVAAARLAAALASAEALERCAREAAEMAAPSMYSARTSAYGYAYARKNAEAMRCVVELAKRVGDALDEKCWEHVLVAASRYDKIFSAAAGFDEASLFGGNRLLGDSDRAKPGSVASTAAAPTAPTAFGSPFRENMGNLNLNVSAAFKNSPTLANVFGGAGVFGTLNAADESPFAHLKKPPSASLGTSHESVVRQTPDERVPFETPFETNANPFDDLDSPDFVPPSGPAATRALSPDATSAAYLASASLGGDAVVFFTRALCAVSAWELASSPPRVCSLAKLVEVAHLNMDRVRFVWSRMWAVMSDFFTEACCHATPEVATYAADALRQLATKFLERGELANYSFQNEFLKPFVVVTKRSRSAPIREFIVRCAGSMVSGQARNVKSGWKSVFAILSAAAADAEPETGALAFEIVERVIREHFDRITETDPSVFADCVRCLVAFTRHTGDGEDGVVALNAVAFLRFCALKLADGAVGDLEKGVERAVADRGDGDGDVREEDVSDDPEFTATEKARGVTAFTEADAHVFYWFPLLSGLAELTFDARAEIRRSALEVLFDILDFHGERFSPGFWGKVYAEVLLPIFDEVRQKGEKEAEEAETEEEEDGSSGESSWRFRATSHCLDLLVDLTLRHYERIVTMSPKATETLEALVGLFAALATSARPRLASCGVGAMHRLLSGAGDAMDADGWRVATDALAAAMGAVRKKDASKELLSAQTRVVSQKGETRALLAHAAAETYFARGAVLSAATLDTLIGALVSVATRETAAVRETGSDAAKTSAETEASRATLAVLLHLHAAGTAEADANGTCGFSDAQMKCGASTRDALMRLAVGILDRFASDVERRASAAETTARAPLAADALRALARLDDDAFRRALFSPLDEADEKDGDLVVGQEVSRGDEQDAKLVRRDGYGALTRLARNASTPAETRAALSDVFARRVGPLASRALRRDARERDA